MSGIFFFTLLLGVATVFVGASESNSDGAKEHDVGIDLALRSPLFGFEFLDFMNKIPFVGPIVSKTSDLLANSTSKVVNPTVDIISVLTGGAISKNSILYRFIDSALGRLLSTISGDGGFEAPVVDTSGLFQILNNTLNIAGSAGNSIFGPVMKMLGIPAAALGELLKLVLPILKFFIPTISFGGQGDQGILASIFTQNTTATKSG